MGLNSQLYYILSNLKDLKFKIYIYLMIFFYKYIKLEMKLWVNKLIIEVCQSQDLLCGYFVSLTF